jgi:hypothetical protein
MPGPPGFAGMNPSAAACTKQVDRTPWLFAIALGQQLGYKRIIAGWDGTARPYRCVLCHGGLDLGQLTS